MSADTTSETWVGSPLYVAMVDALADCGLAPALADVARITNASKWTDRDWPSPDRATRDRFHALWTAKAQAACGLDPRVATPVTEAATFTTILPAGAPVVSRETRDRGIADRFLAGETPEALAASCALGIKTIWRILGREGVPVRGPRPAPEDTVAGVGKVLPALPTTRDVPVSFTVLRETLGVPVESRTALQRTLDKLVQRHLVVRNRVGAEWFYQKRPTLARQAAHQMAARRAA
jgi:hypothetical protein